MRTSCRLGAWVFALTTSFLVTSPAAAGPVERLFQLSLHPTDPARMVVTYEYGGGGLLLSADSGRTFKLVCTSMMEASLRSVSRVAMVGDGRILMADYEGMLEDDGRGCGWARVATLKGRWISDMAVDPRDPMLSFAVTSNGGMGMTNGMVKRGAGQSWADIGKREGLLLTRLLIAKTANGARFYQSGLRTVPNPDGGIEDYAPVIRVSDDDGANWEEFPIRGVSAAAVSLEAIDPSNPDRIVAYGVRSNAPDTLIVSSDRGASFREYLDLTQLGGIAFAPDGRVWIGESVDTGNAAASRGLWFASSLDQKAALIADYGIECMGYQPATNTLFVCQGFSFGTANQESGAFTEMFKFTRLRDFVSCEGVDPAAACQTQLCKEYCGPGHFAQAPLCCAYQDEVCGAKVAISEGTATGAQCGADQAGQGAVDAGSASPDGGTRPATAGSGAAGSFGATGAAAPDAPKQKNSGCGCAVLAVDESKRGLSTMLFATMLMLARWRSRASRRAKKTFGIVQ